MANQQKEGSPSQSALRGTCLLGQSTSMDFWSPGQSAQGTLLSAWPISMCKITAIQPISTQGILSAWPISTHGLLHLCPMSTCITSLSNQSATSTSCRSTNQHTTPLPAWPISTQHSPDLLPISPHRLLHTWPISTHKSPARLANQHMQAPV